MAYEVDYTNNLPQTEEKKMDTMWLNLLNAQASLGLLGHVQTSICASQGVKASIMIHLEHVTADVRKGYDEFLEICTNLSEAQFTVPPGFAKINYKFTEEQLKNYQVRIDGFHSDVIKW